MMKILALAIFVMMSSAEQSTLQQLYSQGNREFSAKAYQVSEKMVHGIPRKLQCNKTGKYEWCY